MSIEEQTKAAAREDKTPFVVGEILFLFTNKFDK